MANVYSDHYHLLLLLLIPCVVFQWTATRNVRYLGGSCGQGPGEGVLHWSWQSFWVMVSLQCIRGGREGWMESRYQLLPLGPALAYRLFLLFCQEITSRKRAATARRMHSQCRWFSRCCWWFCRCRRLRFIPLSINRFGPLQQKPVSVPVPFFILPQLIAIEAPSVSKPNKLALELSPLFQFLFTLYFRLPRAHAAGSPMLSFSHPTPAAVLWQ